MRSFYGEVFDKHPEIAGRRYLPNKACIKCHSEQNKISHARRKALLEELFEAANEIRFKEPRLDAALEALGK